MNEDAVFFGIVLVVAAETVVATLTEVNNGEEKYIGEWGVAIPPEYKGDAYAWLVEAKGDTSGSIHPVIEIEKVLQSEISAQFGLNLSIDELSGGEIDWNGPPSKEGNSIADGIFEGEVYLVFTATQKATEND